MQEKKLKRILSLYLSSAITYGVGILLFRYGPYYKTLLHYQTQNTLLILYFGYLILAPFLYLLWGSTESENKPYFAWQGIKKVVRGQFKLNKKEKVAFLFLLVKVFYLPLMINFFFNNYNHLLWLKDHFRWYPFIFTLMFGIDTLVFAFGYSFESKKLKNVVKSVEPTFFGWFVAIICYPPFNRWVGNYIPWGANDYVLFGDTTMTLVFRLVLVFFLLIYVWATIALGFKASNLTNRGIVTKFPYSVIRHPAYISKNLIWWITLLPVLTWQFALGLSLWSIIYFFRVTTEEKHLSKDPAYIRYKKKVKYRLIPGVY